MDATRLLASIPLFDDLATEDLAALAEHLERHRFQEGEAIFRKGDTGDSMFIVASGAVGVELPGDHGKKGVVVKEIHVGQYFGELALFDTKPRSATVVALSECEVLELGREGLHARIQQRPAVALAILAEMSERLRETNELLSSRAAKDVNEVIDAKLTFGDRIADRVAEVAGSWAFILSFIFVLVAWMVLNSIAISKAMTGKEPFDPFPFIFFNLILSIVAAFQGPVIMMSQNRQSMKDRAQADTDFKVNLKNELGIENAQRQLGEVKAQLAVLERSLGPAIARQHAPPHGTTA